VKFKKKLRGCLKKSAKNLSGLLTVQYGPEFGTVYTLRHSKNLNVRNYVFFYGLAALVSLGLLNVKVLGSHSDTPHSVGLLWIRNQPIAETST
jgi:hypothetical protein